MDLERVVRDTTPPRGSEQRARTAAALIDPGGRPVAPGGLRRALVGLLVGVAAGVLAAGALDRTSHGGRRA